VANSTPFLGASYLNEQVVFRVWAPEAEQMRVVVGADLTEEKAAAMTKASDGFFTTEPIAAFAGDLYQFYVDDRGPFPDPASRYQPHGVHGPSAIVDPANYRWHDDDWTGIALRDAIFYELHVGTFTPEGTFRSAAEKLGYLKDLGITAIELMPLADFPGLRNWGYDGVALFAPAHCYGTPDDLRYFVDQAHQTGLAMFVDAVYNHFGPDGAYQGSFSQRYFTKRHQTPWGDGINFDGKLNEAVRGYFIENALRWVREFHFDGLRLDATHTITDDSPRHILTAIASAVAEASKKLGRQLHVIAEDARNLPKLIKPECKGGMGLSGVWADDFHHQIRRGLAGDSDGYFAEFDGSVPSIAETAKQGWLRGGDPAGIEYSRFVYCIQNHDQIGNRAFGERLHHEIDLAAYRAASTLLLLLPQTPLLFMGQEWAASTPFCFFTDHYAELGKLVTAGRRREFESFTSFSRAEIPDPQAPETFTMSKLNWNELTAEPRASMLRFYKSLLRLRRSEANEDPFEHSPQLHIKALDDETVLLRRNRLLAVIRLRGAGEIRVECGAGELDRIWNSEEPPFATDNQPIHVEVKERKIRFSRPGAIVFRNAQVEGA
jgi:maltooligosyltrehalose trehalohydrolase